MEEEIVFLKEAMVWYIWGTDERVMVGWWFPLSRSSRGSKGKGLDVDEGPLA